MEVNNKCTILRSKVDGISGTHKSDVRGRCNYTLAGNYKAQTYYNVGILDLIRHGLETPQSERVTALRAHLVFYIKRMRGDKSNLYLCL
jgi:hypothetical protein